MADDWLDEIEPRIKNSYIYNKFESMCKDDPAGDHAKVLVKDCITYSYHRSKTIIRNLPEFTLHDGEHLFRVLNIMERLLTKPNVDNLQLPELFLLILSAFFHDIGMAPTEDSILSWKKKWDMSPAFTGDEDQKEYELFSGFCAGRPERLKDIDNIINKGQNTLAETLKQYLISEYIRLTHGPRAREIIEKDWNGKIKYRDIDLTVELADLAFSHTSDTVKIRNLDKKLVCGPESYACLPLIAVLLRLSDLLDFDLKRTPNVLFSHLSVKHPVSLDEWGKHRSIESWTISPELIQFHAKCTHPAIEASIHKFCDMIDLELNVCHNILNDINKFNQSIGRELNVQIPFDVDRSKIKTKTDISGNPIYNYKETRFDLSKNQVIDLLMGTKLYGDSDVALRELLQNSIDACLLRLALETKWNNEYKPEIEVKYYSHDSDSILEVTDNGIGMDQHIIDNYYSRVGSSFYKSSEFYALRTEAGTDFIPISKYGIGILSSFMVADTVLVDTRKLYGPHDSSIPINLIIEGQDSIFWIKTGKRKIPGTQTKLILRKNKNPWEDLSEGDFIKAVKNVIPHPPFPIHIKTDNEFFEINEDSYSDLIATSLAEKSWDEHDNVREFHIKIDNIANGLVGSVVVGILEMHDKPVEKIDLPSKTVEIDFETYELEKSIELKNNEIKLYSTTITIDDDGNIDTDKSNRSLAESSSKLALHGIEVPTTLFPNSWSMQKQQVKIEWPFPMLLIIDICGNRELDLNSARNRIVLSDNWLKFEEDLAAFICDSIRKSVSDEYWAILQPILEKSNSIPFKNGLARIQK